MFIAIVAVEEGRIAKFRDDFATLADAQAHVDAYTGVEAVEVPDGTDPARLREIDGEWVVDTAALEAEALAGRRAEAKLSRQAFCLALFRQGMLSEADAIAAAKGDWPASLDDMLAGLSSADAAEARIVWATSTEVRRLHPLLAAIAAHMSVADETLDAMFGIA